MVYLILNCEALCKVTFSISAMNESLIILPMFNNNNDDDFAVVMV